VIDLRAAIRAAKAQGDPNVLSAAIPYARFAGIALETGEDGLFCRMAYQPHLVGNPTVPSLHGGVIGALLESAAILHLLWETDSEAAPRTISMSFDFLHLARPVETRARCIVERLGRRVANVRAEAWQDDRRKPITLARGNFLLPRGRDDPSHRQPGAPA